MEEEMNMNTINSKPYRMILMLIAIIGSLGLSAVANAERGMGHGGMKGGMHCGHGAYGACWKDTLTDEQRNKLAKIKLEHMKVQAPVKAKIKTIKVDLALLVTADKPDTAAINKKIDELTKLKNAKMKEKYKYIAAKRKVLNNEQQTLFDMKVIKKAMKGKYKGHRRH
jgi:Spy/CpxP family protein refolding chaperone